MKTETHPSPGMRSHWPVIPAIRLLWAIMTPLGRPVEPLVYITTARSDGWGFIISLPTARKRPSYRIIYIMLRVHYHSSTNYTKMNKEDGRSRRSTHCSQEACPAPVWPACCEWTSLLGNHLCSISCCLRRSRVSVLEPVKAHSGRTKKTT